MTFRNPKLIALNLPHLEIDADELYSLLSLFPSIKVLLLPYLTLCQSKNMSFNFNNCLHLEILDLAHSTIPGSSDEYISSLTLLPNFKKLYVTDRIEGEFSFSVRYSQ